MAFAILGNPKVTFNDSSGNPLVSGTLAVLNPADDTNKASYPTADDADAATNANVNPVVLDSRGEPPNALFGIDDEDYKLVLKDSSAVTIWTVDDIRCPSRSRVYTLTAAETTAGVTPTDLSYEPGNIKRYGATGDGSTNDDTAVNVWATYVYNGNPGYVPAGTYLISNVPTTTAKSVHIRGDGPDMSVFKRNDSVLLNSGSAYKMFGIVQATSRTGDTVFLSGVGFDQNYAGQDTPSPTTEFQQAHAFSVRSRSTRGYSLVTVENCSFTNSLGDGFAILGTSTSETFGVVNINNVFANNRPYSRADLQFIAGWDVVNISNVDVVSLEVENTHAATSHDWIMNLSNVACDELDLNAVGTVTAGLSPICNADNLVVRNNLGALYEFKFNFQNFDITMDDGQSLNTGEFFFRNGRFYLSDGAATNHFFTHVSGTPSSGITFEGVTFESHSGNSGTVLYVYEDVDGARDAAKVRIKNCRFLPTFMQSVVLRSGQFWFEGNEHYYSSAGNACFKSSGHVTNGTDPQWHFTNEKVITDGVYLTEIATVGDNGLKVWFDGCEVTPGFIWKTTFNAVAPHGTGSVVKIMKMPIHFENANQTVTSSDPTEGVWQQGEIMYYADPAGESAIGVVCTVDGAAAGATFVKFGATI